MRRAVVSLFIGGLLAVPAARSAGTDSQDRVAEIPNSGDSTGDHMHEVITSGVRSTARWLDSFFSRQSYENEVNQSRLRLRFDTFTESGEGARFGLGTNVRLRLPNTSRRLVLTFSGSPDENNLSDDVSDNDNTDTAPVGSDGDRFAGFDYFLKSDALRLVSAQAGARLGGKSRGAFIGARYRRYFTSGEWSNRFVQRLRAFSSTGVESVTTADFDHAVLDNLLFRTTFKGTWYHDEDGYFYDVNLRLFQPLSRKRAVEYQWDNSFETAQSNWHEDTVLRVRYRQQVWRPWMVLEVAPQIAFRRDDNFDAKPGILFRVETVFGG